MITAFKNVSSSSSHRKTQGLGDLIKFCLVHSFIKRLDKNFNECWYYEDAEFSLDKVWPQINGQLFILHKTDFFIYTL